MKRLKVAAIMILLAVGLLLRDIAVWALALVQAGVTLGINIAPLMKAAQILWSDLWMMPVRFFVAFLVPFGVGIDLIEKVFPEVVKFVQNDLPPPKNS